MKGERMTDKPKAAKAAAKPDPEVEKLRQLLREIADGAPQSTRPEAWRRWHADVAARIAAVLEPADA